jgi:Flp pilus assembly pilin Flp
MMKKSKAQTALVYAALIGFVVIALIAMFGYIQQKVQGVYKQAGDSIGEGEILN